MYIALTEIAAGFLVRKVGKKATRYLVITMPKILLEDNLFKDKNYDTYCRNASINNRTSLKEAEETYKELKKSLSKDYKVIMVDVLFTKRK